MTHRCSPHSLNWPKPPALTERVECSECGRTWTLRLMRGLKRWWVEDWGRAA